MDRLVRYLAASLSISHWRTLPNPSSRGGLLPIWGKQRPRHCATAEDMIKMFMHSAGDVMRTPWLNCIQPRVFHRTAHRLLCTEAGQPRAIWLQEATPHDGCTRWFDGACNHAALHRVGAAIEKVRAAKACGGDARIDGVGLYPVWRLCASLAHSEDGCADLRVADPRCDATASVRYPNRQPVRRGQTPRFLSVLRSPVQRWTAGR